MFHTFYIVISNSVTGLKLIIILLILFYPIKSFTTGVWKIHCGLVICNTVCWHRSLFYNYSNIAARIPSGVGIWFSVSNINRLMWVIIPEFMDNIIKHCQESGCVIFSCVGYFDSSHREIIKFFFQQIRVTDFHNFFPYCFLTWIAYVRTEGLHLRRNLFYHIQFLKSKDFHFIEFSHFQKPKQL